MTEKPKTIKVRMLVRVGLTPEAEGEFTWSAVGWGTTVEGYGQDEVGIRQNVDEFADGDWVDGGRYTWVVADVPVPDEVTDEVKGRVES